MLNACLWHQSKEVVIYESEQENQREGVKITFLDIRQMLRGMGTQKAVDLLRELLTLETQEE